MPLLRGFTNLENSFDAFALEKSRLQKRVKILGAAIGDPYNYRFLH